MKHKYQSDLCNDTMSFQDCELAILRHAVDQSEARKGKQIAQSDDVRAIIGILEEFLRKRKCVCYGGTAINNILPKYDQFYNRDVEIPDYDFYSIHALNDAKDLADLYYVAGYTEVEAKAGVHHGTYKVYVNFIPVADITVAHPTIFKSIQREAIIKDGIYYAPPNYLRMAMYLELSRPDGDVSRWEKVLKRINLLNKHYPLRPKKALCDTIDFQRQMDSSVEQSETIYYSVRDMLIEHEAVFFGGYATSLYSKYMPENRRRQVFKIPDFDVLSEHPEEVAQSIKSQLKTQGFHKIRIVRHPPLGEIIPEHFEIVVEGETMAFLYRPMSCHSYNKIMVGDREIRIATIDTMLSLYLAFIYADKPYFNKDRILCMSMFLFDVEQNNRLNQKGLLRRFTLSCYGNQETLEDIRALKTQKFKELEKQKSSEEYQAWFLRYNPATNKELVRDTVKSVPKPKQSRRRKYSSSKTIDVETEAQTRLHHTAVSTTPVTETAEGASAQTAVRTVRRQRRGARKTRKVKFQDYWSDLWRKDV